jgi:hypothetical protein
LRIVHQQTIQTPEQQKWAAKLQGFSFEIFYKPGKSNLVADALSRKHADLGQCSLFLSVSTVIPTLLSRLQRYYKTEKDGIVYFKDQIYIPEISDLRHTILNEYHSTPFAGHSGLQPTLARLSTSFLWPEIYKDVKDLIHKCSVCQQNKNMTTKKQGLLQPLEVPEKVWEELTMDFITHLPNSFGHTVVWVICDRLTKYVHFIGLPTKFSAQDLASRFSTEVCRLHGIPKSIIYDRDPLFLSNFWKKLFRLQGTTFKYSSSYHPETDGETEVVNRNLETYLRCLASEHPRQWFKFLHLAEYWYNSAFHSAIKMSLFEALYSRSPPAIPDYVTGQSTIVPLNNALEQRQRILSTLKQNLYRSRKKKWKIKQIKKERIVPLSPVTWFYSVCNLTVSKQFTVAFLKNFPKDILDHSQFSVVLAR